MGWDFQKTTVEISILSAANVAVLIKTRLHEIADDCDKKGMSSFGDEIVFRDYLKTLNELNRVLPQDMRSEWVREPLVKIIP
jgi:hypothetical protein